MINSPFERLVRSNKSLKRRLKSIESSPNEKNKPQSKKPKLPKESPFSGLKESQEQTANLSKEPEIPKKQNQIKPSSVTYKPPQNKQSTQALTTKENKKMEEEGKPTQDQTIHNPTFSKHKYNQNSLSEVFSNRNIQSLAGSLEYNPENIGVLADSLEENGVGTDLTGPMRYLERGEIDRETLREIANNLFDDDYYSLYNKIEREGKITQNQIKDLANVLVTQLEDLAFPIDIDTSLKLVAILAPWRLQEAIELSNNRIPGALIGDKDVKKEINNLFKTRFGNERVIEIENNEFDIRNNPSVKTFNFEDWGFTFHSGVFKGLPFVLQDEMQVSSGETTGISPLYVLEKDVPKWKVVLGMDENPNYLQ